MFSLEYLLIIYASRTYVCDVYIVDMQNTIQALISVRTQRESENDEWNSFGYMD